VSTTEVAPERIGRGARGRRRETPTLLAWPDATGAVTTYVVLLLGVPAGLVFGPLGAAGTPAQLVAIALLIWWCAVRLSRPPQPSVGQPVRRALLFFAAALLASYVAANMRSLDGTEMRAADRGLLSLCGWIGIVLVVTDAIPDRRRLDRLLSRLVMGGAIIATIAIVQFYTGFNLVKYVQIPGLSVNSSVGLVLERGDFRRPAATATHPIELGVVLAMLVPIGMHYALYGVGSRLRRWLPTAVIAVALPLTLSRSALLGGLVVLLLVLPTWPTARRRRAYVVLAIGLVAMYLGVPGMLGTFRNLITGLAGDSSTTSRTGSYSVAKVFVEQAPISGRGFGTFLPSYHILDNQYLMTAIEAGLLGVTALVLLLLTGVFTARGVRRRIKDPDARDLAQCLAASAAVAVCTFATYDELSFPMSTGLTFLVLGAIGALWRMYVSTDVGPRSQAAPPFVPLPLRYARR
jgi:O-antigen ligase